MTKPPATEPTTATGPTFDAVAIDSLPARGRPVSGATVAIGTAILAVLDGGMAAQEPTTHASVKDATKRAALLKRAVKTVRPDAMIASRIIAVDGGFRIAILATPTAEPTAEPKRGSDLAD